MLAVSATEEKRWQSEGSAQQRQDGEGATTRFMAAVSGAHFTEGQRGKAMQSLAVAITESTCGEACWAAREDVCRCSCVGRNHGVLRGDGIRPDRTRKLNGYVYIVLAVEAPGGSCMAATQHPLEELKRNIVQRAIDLGLWDRYAWDSTPGSPVKIKTASESEVARWPELAAWRDNRRWRPETVWIRADMAHLTK